MTIQSDHDLEAYLRSVPGEYRVVSRVNEEGRVQIYIHPYGRDGMTLDYIVVENLAVPLKKPATQGVSIQGFDAHKAMGDRS